MLLGLLHEMRMLSSELIRIAERRFHTLTDGLDRESECSTIAGHRPRTLR